jgi:hypothetical protein
VSSSVVVELEVMVINCPSGPRGQRLLNLATPRRFAPAILFQGNNIPNSVCIQIPDVGAVIDRAYIRRKSS